MRLHHDCCLNPAMNVQYRAGAHSSRAFRVQFPPWPTIYHRYLAASAWRLLPCWGPGRRRRCRCWRALQRLALNARKSGLLAWHGLRKPVPYKFWSCQHTAFVELAGVPGRRRAELEPGHGTRSGGAVGRGRRGAAAGAGACAATPEQLFTFDVSWPGCSAAFGHPSLRQPSLPCRAPSCWSPLHTALGWRAAWRAPAT